MWTCPNCKIEVEPEYDVCWSCGTSREGEPNPGFDPESEGMMGAEDYEAETEAKRREDLATVATYWSAPEAHVVRSRLEAEGISAVVTGELATTATWGLLNVAGGVKVVVPQAQLAKAREILQSCQHVDTPKEQIVAQAVKEGIQTKPSPPVENSTVEEETLSQPTAEELIMAGYRTAILGLSMLFPLVLILPINVYSMYLLLRSLRGRGEISAAAQRRFLIALVINLAFLLLWWIPLAGYLTYIIVRRLI